MSQLSDIQSTNWNSKKIQARVKARQRREKRFRFLGLAALVIATGFLFTLISTIGSNGIRGLFQTYVKLEVNFPENAFKGNTLAEAINSASYQRLIRQALYDKFPTVQTRRDRRRLSRIISPAARTMVRDYIIKNPQLIGQTQNIWLLASDDIDQLQKGLIDTTKPERNRRVKDIELKWVETLEANDAIQIKFHTRFFTGGDSRDPENVGIWGAIVGTFLTLLVTLAVAFPVGVLSAVYLEEFAKKNRFTDFVEININNLAAVPSIVFGLLGLAVFLGTFNLPRSVPLVGGMTLALMTLPTIIIASRAAIKAVPTSIRDAARALGASPVQVVFHHVLPLAMPGILTGTIIGMGQALGETAPLLMIGMVAFIVDIPSTIMDPATVLPVQIYIWANSPERLFLEKTSAAILVLLVFLICMNALAIWLRHKFEKKL